MTKEQNDQLVRIATALGFTVAAISPAFYGSDWGRLDLVDPATGDEFPWNPLTHAGDRYKLIQKLRMAVDFSDEIAVAKMESPGKVLPCSVSLRATFSQKDDSEPDAIVGLADQWAQSILQARQPAG